jgi:hypothetical protein
MDRDTRQGPKPGEKFFLFIGTTTSEAAVSKLKTAGIYYQHKMLESGVENWKTITGFITSPNLIGVIAKLTSRNFELMVQPDYESTAKQMLESLAATKHLLFIHESGLSGEYDYGSPPPEWDGDTPPRYNPRRFGPPSEKTRRKVLTQLEDYGVNVVPYRTNAELAVLAAAFVEDNENNLLFRIYVPTGRIYAAEADKLLSMFRDWLTKVKKLHIREDGYSTGRGQVYEFFGDDDISTAALADQFDDFSQFLDLCVSTPDKALDLLARMGVAKETADDLVRRYGKETKRLHLDIRHAREAKLLSLQHRLESELVDVIDGDGPGYGDLATLIDRLVPNVSSPQAALDPPLTAATTSEGDTPLVVVNQQIIGSVEGMVVQELHGSAELGVEAKELIRLIDQFGDKDMSSLQSAVYELEDVDARPADRLSAKQRLKGFLYKLSGKAEETALSVLQRYVESKVGL